MATAMAIPVVIVGHDIDNIHDVNDEMMLAMKAMMEIAIVEWDVGAERRLQRSYYGNTGISCK